MKNIFTLVFLGIFVQFSFGQIDFQEHIIISEKLEPLAVSSVKAADMDGDGDIDLLSGSNRRVIWYENLDGQGNFNIPNLIFQTDNLIYNIYPVDIDGDGDMDVLSASSPEGIYWHENIDGEGNFGEEHLINELGDRSVISEDVDGDGDMDVITPGTDDIAWYENLDGQGNFGERIIISSSFNTNRYAFSTDFDADGDIDFISKGYSSDIWFIENSDGQGNFVEQKIIDSEEYNDELGTPVDVSDIDGDGDLDILAINNGVILWLEKTDTDSYIKHIIIQIAIGSGSEDASLPVSQVDIDGDGDLDILFWSTIGGNIISWMENLDSQGNFGEPQTIPGYSYIQDIVTTDVDGDGFIDVASTSGYRNIVWSRNTNGLGNFELQDLVVISAIGLESIDVADLDSDGDQDVVSISRKIAWYENLDGQGDVMRHHEIVVDLPTFCSKFIRCVDMDLDGDFDLLTTTHCNNSEVAWYENLDGLANFGPRQTINVYDFNTIHPADVDGDGDIDILTTSYSSSSIAWFENIDGLATYELNQTFSNNALGAKSVFGVDIDNDGDLDVISGSKIDNKIAWYENLDGSGNFGMEQVVTYESEGGDDQFVYSADLDGDGDNDILGFGSRSESSEYTLCWFENLDGQGEFGSQQIIYSDVYAARAIHASDLDNDSDLDIISGVGHEIFWFENRIQGNFGPKQIISETSLSVFNLFAKDINNDGNMDIVAASHSDYEIAWYQNDMTLSVVEFKSNLFFVFPNPTKSSLTVKSEVDIRKVSIFDINGRILSTILNTKSNKNMNINVEDLANGIYFLQIDANTKHQTVKFIKN